MPSLHRGRVAAMGAQDALTYTRLRAESRFPMRLALELFAFIFVASIIPVIPTLLAIWYDRRRKIARLMAVDFAEQVIPIWKKYSQDKRPELAIKAARDFAEGRITRDELAAARAAAWAAARDARDAVEAARDAQEKIFIGYLQP